MESSKMSYPYTDYLQSILAPQNLGAEVRPYLPAYAPFERQEETQEMMPFNGDEYGEEDDRYYAEGGYVEPAQIEEEVIVAPLEGEVIVEDEVQNEAPLSDIAEILQSKGRYGDSMLVHINLEEFEQLNEMFGPMTLNPETGLPEFFFKKILGPGALSILGGIVGNMLMPGVGGFIGSSLGGAAGGMIGHKNNRMGPVGGALMGAAMPTLASGLGSLASAGGLTNLGGALSNYGGAASLSNLLPASKAAEAISAPAKSPETSFMSELLRPKNLIAAAPLVMKAFEPSLKEQAIAQGKAQLELQDMANSPERQIRILNERKRVQDAERAMNRAEREAEENRRRSDQEALLDELSEEIVPADAEHTQNTGQYFRRYRGRGDKRREVAYADGGFVGSATDGKADLIPAWLSGGEYVIPAKTVANLGHGNSLAGAKKLDRLSKVKTELQKYKEKTLKKKKKA
jgi:hypothetical protein